MSQRKATSATIDKTLVYYDGPQLLLLRSEYNDPLLAVAIEKDGYRYPLLCCQMLPRVLNKYMEGTVDLRFVFNQTPVSRMYFADIGQKFGDRIRLVKAKEGELNEDVYPDSGLFARLHTGGDISGEYRKYADKKRFNIDGAWEARDFSRFHGRIADAYSLLFIAKAMNKGVQPSPSEARFLRASIEDRPWQGGGSYLAFYTSVKNDGIPLHPLRVAGIEYHSPGYVDLAGRNDVLDDVVLSIADVMENHAEIVGVYRAIRRVLSGEGLLSAGREATFANEVVEEYVRSQSLGFASLVSLPNAESVLTDACDGNVLVFAKLILSYYRRLKGIADFFIEGRVSVKQMPETIRDGASASSHSARISATA